MQVEVDQSRCVASGQCAMTAPAVFDQDDDGKVLVLAPAPPPSAQGPARQAAAMCPGMAITTRDDT
ncbi:ferredoxin [Streptomyces sp. NPDC005573]|uniref:ferredoxin n=1 Tax=Streptomyces sp. NPDC005573 TaxID=3156890 RepID=UPI0033B8181E